MPLLLALKGENLNILASGGLRSGLDLARALALGARMGGMARPFIQAAFDGGEEAVDALIEETALALRAVMLLTGSPDLAALSRTSPVIDAELQIESEALT